MPRRLVALLVAVGLVVIALVIRNGIDNGGGNSAGEKLKLVCTPELQSVCAGLGSDVQATVEEPGVTADRLKTADTAGIDGWLTPGPWPQIVAGEREAAGLAPVLKVGPALGRSRIGLAVWPDRLIVLNRACPGLPWRCIGDVAAKGTWAAVGGNQQWGLVKIGFPDASTNATGLAALGAGTTGYFGSAPINIGDDGFTAWVRALVTASKNVQSSLEPVLAIGPSVADMVAVFESTATPTLKGSARPDNPVLTYPAPVASADVVLGSADTDRGRRLAALLTSERVQAAGWNTSGVPLPAPDVLDALRTTWKDAGG